MHKEGSIVINTGPLLAIIAALGSLEILKFLYSRAIIPYEVSNEILVSNIIRFGAAEFNDDLWIEKRNVPTTLSPFLKNSLDAGEASVIQLALDEKIPLVCIDETVGRRIARLSNLKVTGSLGILIKSKNNGFHIDVENAIIKMRGKGIWIGKELEQNIIRELKNK
jgi:predicted nucleic acid-binding protein